jgi:biotin carboxylase
MAGQQNKTILLLGASQDQVFIIKVAKRMGLRTVVVDMNPNSPGFLIADDHAVVSTRDTNALKKFVDEYRFEKGPIHGVSVMGSDIPHIVAEIAEYLGVPSIPSMETGLLTTHKYNMKKRLAECGVRVPPFDKVAHVDDVFRFAGRWGYPIITKPVDRAGARGVFKINNPEKVNELYALSREHSLSGDVIVEKFLEGPQYSTESIMVGGRLYTPGFSDRNYEMLEELAPNIIENGGIMPTGASLEERLAVEDALHKAGLALGIQNGVVKGDVVVSKDGVHIIEIASRLSGGDMSEGLIPISCGVNVVVPVLQFALGEEVNEEALVPKHTQFVVNRYFFPRSGKFVRINGEEEVRAKEWITKLEFWYKPGDIVPKIDSHGSRFGVFVAVGDTREEVLERAKWVYDTINIVIDAV